MIFFHLQIGGRNIFRYRVFVKLATVYQSNVMSAASVKPMERATFIFNIFLPADLLDFVCFR